jgi:hypothetical protein
VPLPPPAEPEEVPPPPLAEPEEVPPPLPEEVKRLKPPRRKVPLPMRAPSVNVEDACFSVKMLYQAWQSLKKMAVHLGSNGLLSLCRQCLGWASGERSAPPDDDGGLDVSSSGSDSDSDSDGAAPPAATTSA